jgi:hypothetical protein
MRLARTTFLLSLAFLLPGCAATLPANASGASAEAALLGRWVGTDRTAFEFQPDGHALWIFSATAPPDTFHIRYRYDPSRAPAHLDLYDIERGPLAGRTLYCITEPVDPDTFRAECEPSFSETARPTAFTQDVRIYRRQP